MVLIGGYNILGTIYATQCNLFYIAHNNLVSIKLDRSHMFLHFFPIYMIRARPRVPQIRSDHVTKVPKK